MLVRASFGASLYTTAHEQLEWPPRVSGRTRRESKQSMRKLNCNYTHPHFQRNFYKRQLEREKAVHLPERKLREDLATRRHQAEAEQKSQATHAPKKQAN